MGHLPAFDRISDYAKYLNPAHPHQQADGPAAGVGVFSREDDATRCTGVSRPHRRGFYKMSVLSRGGGTFLLGGEAVGIDGPALVVAPPHAALGWTLEGDQAGAYVLFTAAFHDVGLLPLYRIGQGGRGLFEASYARLTTDEHEAVEETVAHVEASQGAPELARLHLRVLLKQAETLGARDAQPRRTTAAERIVEAYDHLMSAAAADGHPLLRPVAEYARALYVSPSHLSTSCTAVTGKPARALLQERVAAEAGSLLQGTTLAVGDIALRLGFFDASHFTNWFRKRVGSSPSAYRSREAST